MMEDETLVLYAYVSCSSFIVTYKVEKLMKADTSNFLLLFLFFVFPSKFY